MHLNQCHTSKGKYKILLCKNCNHCRLKSTGLECSEGYFKNIDEKKLETLTPFDMDCLEWEGE